MFCAKRRKTTVNYNPSISTSSLSRNVRDLWQYCETLGCVSVYPTSREQTNGLGKRILSRWKQSIPPGRAGDWKTIGHFESSPWLLLVWEEAWSFWIYLFCFLPSRFVALLLVDKKYNCVPRKDSPHQPRTWKAIKLQLEAAFTSSFRLHSSTRFDSFRQGPRQTTTSIPSHFRHINYALYRCSVRAAVDVCRFLPASHPPDQKENQFQRYRNQLVRHAEDLKPRRHRGRVIEREGERERESLQ